MTTSDSLKDNPQGGGMHVRSSLGQLCWSLQDYTVKAQLTDQQTDPLEVYTSMFTWSNQL